MTPLAALALLRHVEAMPAEHAADPPRVDLWWRISPELPTATGPRVGVVGHGHDEAAALRAVERDARAVLRGHLAWLVAWAHDRDERGSAEQAARAWASVRAVREVVDAVDGERIMACDSAHLQHACR